MDGCPSCRQSVLRKHPLDLILSSTTNIRTYYRAAGLYTASIKQEGWLPPTKRASAVKTRMNGLSCGEKIMTICSAVLIQYQRVTLNPTIPYHTIPYQRVTDRLTDGQNLDS